MQAEAHAEQSHPGTIGKFLMFVAIAGGFWLLKSMQYGSDVMGVHIGKILPVPLWATMLILAICGVVIGGASTLVPEEKGGRASTYIAFVLLAWALLLMFYGWFFHAAGSM